jgi:hypothetical protein
MTLNPELATCKPGSDLDPHTPNEQEVVTFWVHHHFRVGCTVNYFFSFYCYFANIIVVIKSGRDMSNMEGVREA